MTAFKDPAVRLQSSIFIKLTVIVLVSGILIYGIVIGFFKAMYNRESAAPYYYHLYEYVNYLSKDLTIPVDSVKAGNISEKLSLRILITENNNVIYRSDSLFSSISGTEDLKLWKDEVPYRIGEINDQVFLSVSHDQYIWYFLPHNQKIFQPNWWMVSGLIVALSLVMLLAFFAIRKILYPVKLLMVGVNEVSQGNLDFQFKSRHSHRHDEFDRISATFNQMTVKIKEMINARDQLLLDVSHELRSPLTRIKVALEFLPENKTRENIAADILDMENMVTEILESARLKSVHGSLKKNMTDVVRLVQSVSEMMHESSRIVILNDDQQVNVSVDEDRLKTVIKNVLENAIKYSSENVTVRFETNSEYKVIYVQDSGSGIPADELPYIFEPFYRVDKSRTKSTGGFGLGMSLCRTIMEAHGGKIEVTSEPNAGTTVRLLLP